MSKKINSERPFGFEGPMLIQQENAILELKAGELDPKQRFNLLRKLAMPQQVVLEKRIDPSPTTANIIVYKFHELNGIKLSLANIYVSELPNGSERDVDGLKNSLNTQYNLILKSFPKLLKQFAHQQLESFKKIASSNQLNTIIRYIDNVKSQHPYQAVLHLLTYEPQLMLSNLNLQELFALYSFCREAGLYENYSLNMTGLRTYIFARASTN
ncbi:MAG: hypothetical protein H6772_03005 [Pseudomonadales bacterium]|nr:hypothetical protein [Pseudomonadales bacterium]